MLSQAGIFLARRQIFRREFFWHGAKFLGGNFHSAKFSGGLGEHRGRKWGVGNRSTRTTLAWLLTLPGWYYGCGVPAVKGLHCAHCHACHTWANGRPEGAGFDWPPMPFGSGEWKCANKDWENTSEDDRCCDYCQKRETENKKLRRCTRCLGVRYCDARCQRADWPEHRQFCKTKEEQEEEKVEGQ